MTLFTEINHPSGKLPRQGAFLCPPAPEPSKTLRAHARSVFVALVLSVPLFATPLHATDEFLDAGRTATMDFLMERAISNKMIAGGVVVIGNRDGILYSMSSGGLHSGTGASHPTDRTIFDVASLTKVLATTPAIMKLLEDGRVSLLDPVTRWFPEFEGSGREDITILNLLTHTSGLDDTTFSPNEPFSAAIGKAVVRKTPHLPGYRFRYADINFILLGELVHRVTGTTLDTFCREHLYAPLGMNDTMFLPPRERSARIAPTYREGHELPTGIVQDENARHLGGVAGHAGLFSTAFDLSLFARLVLGGGSLDGKRIFSEQVVTQMTAPYFYSSGRVVRGLGWDIESPYSAPRGSSFSEMSFGHTGYSGSSIWIDPQRNLFVILLTTRLDYRDIRMFSRLRSDISSLAAATFRTPGGGGEGATTAKTP